MDPQPTLCGIALLLRDARFMCAVTGSQIHEAHLDVANRLCTLCYALAGAELGAIYEATFKKDVELLNGRFALVR
jgi:hypothetical protein